MISLGGAIVLLISVFFSWYSVAGFTASGWSATDVAKLVFLLALVAGAAWVIDLFVPTVQIPYPAWMIAGAAGGLAILLVLFRMASKPGGPISGALSLAWGIYLALIAAIAVVVGAYLRMNESSS